MKLTAHLLKLIGWILMIIGIIGIATGGIDAMTRRSLAETKGYIVLFASLLLFSNGTIIIGLSSLIKAASLYLTKHKNDIENAQVQKS